LFAILLGDIGMPVFIRIDVPRGWQNKNKLKTMKKTITIVCSEEVPVKHLLNSQDFKVSATDEEDWFAMSRKEKVEDSGVEIIDKITNNIKPEGE
jgi:hypothetical protein